MTAAVLGTLIMVDNKGTSRRTSRQNPVGAYATFLRTNLFGVLHTLIVITKCICIYSKLGLSPVSAHLTEDVFGYLGRMLHDLRIEYPSRNETNYVPLGGIHSNSFPTIS
jgi:hypothetical protein